MTAHPSSTPAALLVAQDGARGEAIQRLRDHLEFDAGQWQEMAEELECCCEVDTERCLRCRCLGLARVIEVELGFADCPQGALRLETM